MMTDKCKDQFPAGMTVKATYRKTKDRPGFSTFWYEGKNKDGALTEDERWMSLALDLARSAGRRGFP